MSPIEVYDTNTITDDEVKQIYKDYEGVEPSPESIPKIREQLKSIKTGSLFNPLSNKIYVFSDKLSEGNEEKAIFHENLHKALHDHYGDQVRQIAEEFWETSSPSHPESTKLNKERISEEYKDNPEEAKEEYFVRLAAHQMTEGNIDE